MKARPGKNRLSSRRPVPGCLPPRRDIVRAAACVQGTEARCRVILPTHRSHESVIAGFGVLREPSLSIKQSASPSGSGTRLPAVPCHFRPIPARIGPSVGLQQARPRDGNGAPARPRFAFPRRPGAAIVAFTVPRRFGHEAQAEQRGQEPLTHSCAYLSPVTLLATPCATALASSPRPHVCPRSRNWTPAMTSTASMRSWKVRSGRRVVSRFPR